MAVSPAFVGTPRTTTIPITSALYLLQTAFTAGTSGSVVKNLWISCVADQQLYANVHLVAGGVTLFLGTVPLRATTVANAAVGQLQNALDILNPAYIEGVTDARPYLELGADEVIKVSVTTVLGAAPDADESARIRALAADY